eukprot:scaffold58247_cov20-Attheya_sp.AAC.1
MDVAEKLPHEMNILPLILPSLLPSYCDVGTIRKMGACDVCLAARHMLLYECTLKCPDDEENNNNNNNNNNRT